MTKNELKRAVWQLEDGLLGEIRLHGPGKRLVLKGLYPDYEGKMEVVCRGGSCGSSALINPDSKPGDTMITMTSGGEPQSCVLRFSGTVPGRNLPYSAFNSREADSLSFQFLGEGEFPNQLTFAYLEGIGYVYLRGKGRVVLSTGETVDPESTTR